MKWDRTTRKFIDDREKINRGHDYKDYLQAKVDKGEMTEEQRQGYIYDHRNYKHVKIMQCDKVKKA